MCSSTCTFIHAAACIAASVRRSCRCRQLAAAHAAGALPCMHARRPPIDAIAPSPSIRRAPGGGRHEHRHHCLASAALQPSAHELTAHRRPAVCRMSAPAALGCARPRCEPRAVLPAGSKPLRLSSPRIVLLGSHGPLRSGFSGLTRRQQAISCSAAAGGDSAPRSRPQEVVSCCACQQHRREAAVQVAAAVAAAAATCRPASPPCSACSCHCWGYPPALQLCLFVPPAGTNSSEGHAAQGGRQRGDGAGGGAGGAGACSCFAAAAAVVLYVGACAAGSASVQSLRMFLLCTTLPAAMLPAVLRCRRLLHSIIALHAIRALWLCCCPLLAYVGQKGGAVRKSVQWLHANILPNHLFPCPIADNR